MLSSLTQKATSVMKFEDLFRHCCETSNSNNNSNNNNKNSNNNFNQHNILPTDSKNSKLLLPLLKNQQQNPNNSNINNCLCYPCPPQQPLSCGSSKLPQLVVKGNMRPGSCCHHYECRDQEEVCKNILCNDGEHESETCPSDSSEIPLDSPFDGCCFKRKGCQCKPQEACIEKEVRCSEGLVRRVLEVARGIPAACCNKYDCINVTLVGSSNCTYKDSIKKAGDNWLDGCMSYQCKAGIVIGSNVPCPSHHGDQGRLKCDWMGFKGNNSCCAVCKGCVGEDGSFHMNGQSWRPSSCMECRCQDGQKYCQAETCQSICSNPVIVAGSCCPVCQHNESHIQLDSACGDVIQCSLMCPHGYKEGLNGCPRCECQDGDDDDGESKRKMGKNDEDDEEDDDTITGCDLKCWTGYVRDAKTGEKKCQCKVKVVKGDSVVGEENGGSEDDDEKKVGEFKVPTSPTHKIAFEGKNEITKKGKHFKRCTSLEKCHLQCVYGFKKDLDGCATCHCNRCPSFDCLKRCPSGYQTNNDNCFICKCLHSGPFPELHQPPISSPSPPPLLPHHKSILDGVKVARHCVSANEHRLEHGQAWWDGCRRCFCHRGYEMCELVTCPPVQCSSPVLLPDKCCLTCPGKDAPAMMEKTGMCLSGEGRLLVEGETWSLDDCTFCLCHQGTPLCTIEMCAPLLCTHPIIQPHTCCPICPFSLDHLNTPLLPTDPSSPHLQDNRIATSATSPGNHSCVSPKNGIKSNDGDVWKVSACQSCYCRHGVIHCFSQTCPILGCHKTVLKKGHCCPSCLDISVHYCEYNHETYDNRESWMVDDCTTCACMDGHVMCTMSICAPTQCARPIHLPGKCCAMCPANSKAGCTNNKAKKESTQHLNISLIVVLIAIIAILAVAIVVLLIMLLWLKPRLRRSSSLNLPNPLFFFNTHRRDHVPLNDEKSVSSSFLPLNSVSTHIPNNHQPTLSSPPPTNQFPPSNHTTPKLGRSSVDAGFDAPYLSAAISSMTTASLASSSSSAAKKRLSSLDGCSGSDEKTVASETSREDVTKPPSLPTAPIPSTLPPLPPRRPPSFRGSQISPYDGGQVTVRKERYDDDNFVATVPLFDDGEKGGDDDDEDEDLLVPPPIPPNHPEEGMNKMEDEAKVTKPSWHSDQLDSEQSSNLLPNKHDINNDNNSDINKNNRRSW